MYKWGWWFLHLFFCFTFNFSLFIFDVLCVWNIFHFGEILLLFLSNTPYTRKYGRISFFLFPTSSDTNAGINSGYLLNQVTLLFKNVQTPRMLIIILPRQFHVLLIRHLCIFSTESLIRPSSLRIFFRRNHWISLSDLTRIFFENIIRVNFVASFMYHSFFSLV